METGQYHLKSSEGSETTMRGSMLRVVTDKSKCGATYKKKKDLAPVCERCLEQLMHGCYVLK